MVERVLQGTPNLISQPFYQGSDPADPGTVTVTVRSDDGTTLATGPASGTGTDPRTFTLTGAHTASLDRLQVTWASSALGTPPPMIVEVVGGFLFSTREITGHPDSVIQDARTRVEQTLEQAVGFAFVPRYDRATITGETLLRLRPYARRVRWATTTLAGVTTTVADLTAVGVSQAGFVSGFPYYGSMYGSVTFGYEHGMDSPPDPVRAAALDYARFLLNQDTSIDSRAERLVTDDGTLIFAATGATPVPAVNQIIDSYRIPAIA
jgi:hypothetical protein